ncbi:hypothetical protein KKG08_00980 [Patescibacteria group bacterium]|nr:hypothetical protein [Patescibacteria group bacterium]
MKVKLNVEYSLDKDLWCYDYTLIDASAPSYGEDDDVDHLLEFLPTDVCEIVRLSIPKEMKLERLKSYLKDQYKKEEENFEEIMQEFRDAWEASGDQVIYCLERFYDKPFPFKEVTAYLTTNVVCPYNFDERWFFIRRNLTEGQLSTANHELNHFMFHHYYSDLEEELGEEKANILRESLTLFTDINNEGFSDEKPLRDLYMSKKWLDVDEIINAGKELLLN